MRWWRLVAQWQAGESDTAHLLRLPGQGRERTPAFPRELGGVVRRIRRVDTTVAARLPGDGARLVLTGR